MDAPHTLKKVNGETDENTKRLKIVNSCPPAPLKNPKINLKIKKLGIERFCLLN